ncbi:hypothetical protein OZY43_00285 [Lactobacillus sp. ESL0785]|uniref:PTS sugar transporter subunit IIA n=1 Tax=Lactobacillus sp. ESL0785 TaxID=2983232 RepID=UPI0023FA1378|nr:hypothetical protein [Lactobacillus sp. ESL0785]WEV70919.1 hypothetical protein OZY43_00285 [Lactobacillus sp. ESL0785]
MIKYVIASHSGFAQGMRATLNFLTNNLKQITAITAYDDSQATDLNIDDLQELFTNLEPDDKIIFMTDINTGSVSQKIVPLILNRKNSFLITGVNIPVALSILLMDEKSVTQESLNTLVTDQEAAPKLVNLNDLLIDDPDDE